MDPLDSGELKLVYSAEHIAERVETVAREVNSVYGIKPVLALCVLKGAFIFCADLVRRIKNPSLELDFISLSSYGSNSFSSGKITNRKNLESDIKDRDVLIIEDIVDSGKTMEFLLEKLSKLQPASLRIATLLDKKERRQTNIDVAFSCFQPDKGFFVGYGLDYAEKYRSLPAIYEIMTIS